MNTDKKDEALRLALEALEVYWAKAEHLRTKEDEGKAKAAIIAIREALAEQPAQQQEPVGAVYRNSVTGEFELLEYNFKDQPLGTHQDIYTSPQPAQQQEPVAFEIRAFNATQALIKRVDVAQEKADLLERGFGSEAGVTIVPLYTSPQPSKPWVGLTPEERQACTQSPFTSENYLAIEAKLKEKNA